MEQPTLPLAFETLKLCRGCEQLKPVEDFATKPYGNGKRTRASRCKPCQREWQQRYRDEHGDRVNGNARANYAAAPMKSKQSDARREYREQNADRLREQRRESYRVGYADHPETWHAARSLRRQRSAVGLDETDRALSRAYRRAIRNDSCFYCGATVPGDMHVDHFFPLAKGGTDHWWNLVRSCGLCNRRKRATCGTRFLLKSRSADEPGFAAAVA